jgi:amino acid transporter
LLVLYGTGITIGAGIYVLIGAVANHSGRYAPWSFAIAAIVMALTVASYTELSTRFPFSAGEAVYVKAAFHSRLLSTLTGLMTIAVGVVSSAAVALGAAGYLQQIIGLPKGAVMVGVVVGLGAVAAWGILESVLLASFFTLIEVGGLLAIIVAAGYAEVPAFSALVQPIPFDAVTLSGLAFGSLLAFFAFVGFEDLANVVEEAKAPHRDIPRAMVLTLLISTILYVGVAAIAVTAVDVRQLASSSAPLTLVFRHLTDVSPTTISIIAIVATLNTILAQMTMAARVIYGMARQGDLPSFAGRVHARTATPLLATALIVVSVVGLALLFPLERLAEATSLVTLGVFALVNVALWRLHHCKTQSPRSHVRVPAWVPVAGFLTCLGMMATALLQRQPL